MREIKFRGKRIDNGEWVYGYYHACVGEALFIERDYHFKLETKKQDISAHWILSPHMPDRAGWSIKDAYDSHQVIPETVGQFTGLLDKNGKEIYEGDILNCNWLAELGITEVDCEANGVAQFNVDRGGYEVVFGKLRRFWASADGSYEVENIELFQSDEDMAISFEVIGNIHENPELLK